MKDILINIEKALSIAGEILNTSFGKVIESEQKQDQSNIVTQADLDSEHAIINFLKTQYPDHNFLAEETGFQNQNSEFTWVIDPLDGTSNFASRIPWFGIIIALLKNGIPFATGVSLPQQNDIYMALKGEGTFLNGKKVSVSNETDLKKVLFSYCLDFCSKDGQTDYESRIIAQLVRRIRNLRST
ncbi:MAG: inositol monophosphatase family protein, partial [Cytophagales bacterium]